VADDMNWDTPGCFGGMAPDITPTVLEAAGLPPVSPVDGRSFLPLLRGQTQKDREYVFTQLYQTTRPSKP